jgi:large subunit ribosomal protein L15
MVEKKSPGKAGKDKKAAPAARSKAAAPAKTKATKPPKAAKAEAPAARAPRKAARPETPARPQALGIQNLSPAAGATHYRKRVGRGPGSGHGKTAGRGYKGQRSRTGYRHLRGFEGGQMPLHRRIPKRGFTNIFRVEYQVVNLADLDRFPAGEKVTPETLAAARLSRLHRPVKILGDGKIAKALTVAAHKFSANAQAKIEAAGGRCEVIPR